MGASGMKEERMGFQPWQQVRRDDGHRMPDCIRLDAWIPTGGAISGLEWAILVQRGLTLLVTLSASTQIASV